MAQKPQPKQDQMKQDVIAKTLRYLLDGVKALNARLDSLEDPGATNALEPSLPFHTRSAALNPFIFFPVQVSTITSGGSDFWALRLTVQSGSNGALTLDPTLTTAIRVFYSAPSMVPTSGAQVLAYFMGKLPGSERNQYRYFGIINQNVFAIGKVNSGIVKGAAGPFTVYGGSPGAETAIATITSVVNKFATFAASMWVAAANNGYGWYYIASECSS